MLSPLLDVPGCSIPAPDHLVMHITPFASPDSPPNFMGFPNGNTVPQLASLPPQLFTHPEITFGEILGPLISEDPTLAYMRKRVLAEYVGGMERRGPTPFRLLSLYLMAMLSEFNYWLEGRGLSMLDVVVSEERLVREVETGGVEERAPVMVEAMARRRALLAGFGAVEEALPADLRALDDAGEFNGIAEYAERNWAPATVHGTLQCFESLIWLHAGQILLRSPEPFADTDVQTEEWAFWLSTPSFAMASRHAIVVARYADACLKMMQEYRTRKTDGVLGTVPLTSPLLPYTMVYAGWFHIVTLGILNRHSAGTPDTAELLSDLARDARLCVGLLAANGWKQVDSHVKVLVRMMMLAGSGPSEDERAELLLRKETGSPVFDSDVDTIVA